MPHSARFSVSIYFFVLAFIMSSSAAAFSFLRWRCLPQLQEQQKQVQQQHTQQQLQQQQDQRQLDNAALNPVLDVSNNGGRHSGNGGGSRCGDGGSGNDWMSTWIGGAGGADFGGSSGVVRGPLSHHHENYEEDEGEEEEEDAEECTALSLFIAQRLALLSPPFFSCSNEWSCLSSCWAVRSTSGQLFCCQVKSSGTVGLLSAFFLIAFSWSHVCFF
jgi:hypothetical protein